MSDNTLMQMPENYKRQVEWIFGAYELAGVSFPDGFQKDAIQNSVGARKNDSWKDWKCSISIVTNEKGTFLLVEDEGTQGLTGPNYDLNEFRKIVENNEDIDPTWRLARFSSRNVSGGNQTGPGKYGVGKSVYSVASIDYDYCFESQREDGLYVVNRNNCGKIYSKAFENNEAKNKLIEWTGLTPKCSVGTRVIIFNPNEEIVRSIKSGDIIQYIQESWWLSIKRMGENSGIFVNGERVNLPDSIEYDNAYDLPRPETYQPGYRVKHFGLYVSKKGDNEWHGISYYRMGMKIGSVDVDDIPPSIRDKYWGYIEVDKEWEERLADIEDTIHYGVAKNKKRTTIYQYLKGFANSKIHQLLIDWGYVKDKENADKKLQDTLKKISTELQDLFDEMGFEDLGKGPKKPDFAVRWRNIHYPTEGTETVAPNEVLQFGIRINNDYVTDKKFEYRLDVVSKSDDHIVSTLDQGSIKILSGKYYDKDYAPIITSGIAERFEENRIVLMVKVSGSGKEKRKELPFFFDIDKPDNSRREVVLSLHSIDFPREGSRRVNYGESISNVSYLIDNKRCDELDFIVRVGVHNCENPTNPQIVEIGRFAGHVDPYEEVIIDSIPAIEFPENVYSTYIQEGVLELRARVVASAASGEYEKGERITDYRYKIFLNQDEKNGKDGSFIPRTDPQPDNFRRSWYKKYGNDRIIYINNAHPAYLAIQYDESRQIEYMRQEMLKQYVLLYLAEGKFSMFGNGVDLSEMELVEATQCIMDKIEEVYHRSI